MALKHMIAGSRTGFAHMVDKVEHILIGGVLAAAIVVAIRHGFEKGSDRWMGLVFATVLVAAVAMEFRACKQMVISLYRKQIGSSIGWCMLWMVCAASTLYVSFGTAAKNVDDVSAMHKAAFLTYGDVRTSKDEAKAVWDEAQATLKSVRERKWSERTS